MAKVSAKAEEAIKASAKAEGAVKVPAKRKRPNTTSGVGFSIAEMNDTQFSAHLSRVLKRMKTKGASSEKLEGACVKIKARRSEALIT